MYQSQNNTIWVAKSDQTVNLLPPMANRHGLIAGATGTGKTVTLKVLAEGFSDAGVPVFLADIKGDVSGMSQPGQPNPNVDSRVQSLGVEGFSYVGYPVRYWDVYGEKGIPVRTTISCMGPDLLSRILGLSDVQAQVLGVVFKIADDAGLHLIDTKDLKAMLAHATDHRQDYAAQYGALAPTTLAAIQRNVVTLESAGGATFFGEPALDIHDWLVTAPDGRGVINLLSCAKLILSPLLYSTFLLWMLSDLYETLPEAGDLDRPKIVFFFDEAHLLFSDAPKALLDKVEQVARLVRSKGVGVYFISQVPSDIPDTVLAQLGHKVQHALHAYTPSDQKAVRAAAQSFRPNPAFDTEKTLGELGIGEALLSMLDDGGVPTIVERAKVLPPRSYMGAADDATIQAAVKADPLYAKYGTAVDNISAYEQLSAQAAPAAPVAPAGVPGMPVLPYAVPAAPLYAPVPVEPGPSKADLAAMRAQAKAEADAQARAQRQADQRRAMIERTIISQGAPILRGILGSLFRR